MMRPRSDPFPMRYPIYRKVLLRMLMGILSLPAAIGIA